MGKKKEPVRHLCAHCGGEVTTGNGGYVTIPITYTNEVSRKEILHNKCLVPRLKYLDENKAKIVNGMVRR